MPSLGGISAWISIGDTTLPEYGIDIDDDRVKCYVEVPQLLPTFQTSMTPGSPSGSMASPPPSSAPNSPSLAPLEYAINWRIQDLTYTMVAIADIDGLLQIEKIHLGKGTITAARNVQHIDSVPVTDDWSKRRLLKFVKLQASETASPPNESVGTIKLSLYRSGRASLSSGFKTSATGFHTKTTPDPKSLITATTVDGLYSKSHATGLGPITFGPPKKVWTAGTRDKQPYVTFEFLCRSRELITEALPDEGWELTAAPMTGHAFENQSSSPLRRGKSRHEGTDHSHPPVSFPPTSGGANLVKRPSIANRAKKWASDVKQSTQSIRLARGRDSQNKVEVVSTPLDAINNPFAPRANDLPRTPTESAEGSITPPRPVSHDAESLPQEPEEAPPTPPTPPAAPIASPTRSTRRKRAPTNPPPDVAKDAA